MKKREAFFAKSRDTRWLALLLPVAGFLFLVLAVLFQTQLQFKATSADYVIWGVLAFLAAFAVCGFGYANLKLAFGCTAVGIVTGLVCMVYVFHQAIPYPGISGLVTGTEWMVIALIIGVNLEMLLHLYKKKRG